MSSERTKMDAQCFCCKGSPSQEKAQQAIDSEIDMIRLNNALHELGLLSTVTESRKQYLQEIAVAAKQSGRGSSEKEETVSIQRKGFSVLHMNSNYVTDFSGTWKCNSLQHFEDELRMDKALRRLKSIDKHIESKMFDANTRLRNARISLGSSSLRLSRCRQRFQKPYEVPWLHKLENRVSHSSWVPESDSSSKDSGIGNRSNPGSPEKVPAESPNCLVRSRSLDDIEAIHLPDVGPTASNQKSEFETMSQCMEDLHVN